MRDLKFSRIKRTLNAGESPYLQSIINTPSGGEQEFNILSSVRSVSMLDQASADDRETYESLEKKVYILTKAKES
jgi:hypothetical protein